MVLTYPDAPEAFATARECRISRPDIRLPILYLFHGQFDWESDWWAEDRGQLGAALRAAAVPLLAVAPFCAAQRLENKRSQQEPPLAQFLADFTAMRNDVEARFAIDQTRQAVLGISMGGKQAIAAALTSSGALSALGVLSAKVQGRNRDELRAACGGSFKGRGSAMALYYHYCGTAENASIPPDIVENNRAVAEEMAGGGALIPGEGGRHNWEAWRPRIGEFLQQLARTWYS